MSENTISSNDAPAKTTDEPVHYLKEDGDKKLKRKSYFVSPEKGIALCCFTPEFYCV